MEKFNIERFKKEWMETFADMVKRSADSNYQVNKVA